MGNNLANSYYIVLCIPRGYDFSVQKIITNYSICSFDYKYSPNIASKCVKTYQDVFYNVGKLVEPIHTIS